MTRFINGPAQGQTLMLKRSPIFLRVVVKNGKWDALDQIGDRPEPDEQLVAYRIHEKPDGYIHLNAGKASGFYQLASYTICEQQPTEAEMRDYESWCKWCVKMADTQPFKPEPTIHASNP